MSENLELSSQERKEFLYKYKRELIGLKIEGENSEEEEETEKTSQKNLKEKKNFERMESKKMSKDVEMIEIYRFCNVIKKYLQKRPPKQDAILMKEKNLSPDDLEPIYLDYQVIEYCTSLIERIPNAITGEGIYRISGNSKFVKHMWACFNLGNIDFLEDPNLQIFTPHIVTGAFKLYFRELKDPLIPYEQYDQFIKLAKETSTNKEENKTNLKPEKVLSMYKEIVDQMNAYSQNSLYILCKHLNLVASHCETNKMNFDNISIVFGPTIMLPKEETVANIMDNPSKCQVVAYLVQHYEKLFADLKPFPFKRKKTEKQKEFNNQRRVKKKIISFIYFIFFLFYLFLFLFLFYF